jgi:hypothetical protein
VPVSSSNAWKHSPLEYSSRGSRSLGSKPDQPVDSGVSVEDGKFALHLSHQLRLKASASWNYQSSPSKFFLDSWLWLKVGMELPNGCAFFSWPRIIMHANIPHWSLTFSLNCSTEELKHQSAQPYVHTQSSGVCCDEMK